MRKKLISMLLCIIMVCAVAAGCGGKEDSGAKEGKTEGAEASDEKKDAIIMGGKNFTEAFLLSELYALALEEQGYEVERVFNMSTDTLAPAIQGGEVDIYPEYTGTALTDILGHELETDLDVIYETISSEFENQWGIKWLELSSMEDKVAIVMLKERAAALKVTNLTELQKAAEGLVLGDGVNFAEREDDLLRLNKIFGEFAFEVENVDYSLAYSCLDDGTVDVIPGLTTDPQLLDEKYVIIEEDVPVWPPQYVAPIVRGEILEKYPEIEDILNSVSEKLSTENMIKMLDEVVNGGEEYEDVAAEFYDANCK